MQSLFAFLPGMESPMHWVILLGIGILLFGKRLPEMGRHLGKTIIEFKRGMKGLEDEVDTGSMSSMGRQESSVAIEPPRPPQRVTMNVPKFEDGPNNVTPPQA